MNRKYEFDFYFKINKINTKEMLKTADARNWSKINNKLLLAVQAASVEGKKCPMFLVETMHKG